MEKTIKVRSDGVVLLHLPKKVKYKNPRELGWIVGRAFHCKRNLQREGKGAHVFTAFGDDSFGFNLELMRHGDFDRVIVHIIPTGEAWETTRRHLVEKTKGRIVTLGLVETQCCFPISEFGLDKARETEKQLDAEEAERKRRQREKPDLFKTVSAQPCPDLPPIPGNPSATKQTQTAKARIVGRIGHARMD
jgi:hypothetical protein